MYFALEGQYLHYMDAKFFFREVNNGCNNKQRMKGIPVNS